MDAARTPAPRVTSQVDHLIVLAASLAEGVRWCESVLGVTPGPGGEHALMGTHNRLVALASPVYPRAYLELIAIHSGAPCGRTSSTRRWFDLDDPEIQLQLEKNGPQLAHFVARTERAEACVRALARLGLDRGEVLQASRMTPQGLLQWKISVRDDGERLLFGTLPTLIQWGEVHPAQAMAPSGVSLLSLEARHPRPDLLRAAYQAIGLAGVALGQGAPNLVATLQTPRGPVVLESKGL